MASCAGPCPITWSLKNKTWGLQNQKFCLKTPIWAPRLLPWLTGCGTVSLISMSNESIPKNKCLKIFGWNFKFLPIIYLSAQIGRTQSESVPNFNVKGFPAGVTFRCKPNVCCGWTFMHVFKTIREVCSPRPGFWNKAQRMQWLEKSLMGLSRALRASDEQSIWPVDRLAHPAWAPPVMILLEMKRHPTTPTTPTAALSSLSLRCCN